jgi:hypothetical protein
VSIILVTLHCFYRWFAGTDKFSFFALSPFTLFRVVDLSSYSAGSGAGSL